MTNFILIPELTIDSTDENPFFASSDPGAEGKGTSGLFGDSDSDWEELDGGLYLYFYFVNTEFGIYRPTQIIASIHIGYSQLISV